MFHVKHNFGFSNQNHYVINFHQFTARRVFLKVTDLKFHGPSVNTIITDFMGKVISIANQKGGVGKTTTAVNLSASLAAAKKSCLLIDCDAQGNATTGLGINRSGLEKGLYEMLVGSDSKEDVILRTVLSRLQLIGATKNLIGAEVEMASMENKEFLLRQCVAGLRERYDYIFLDCPPSLGFLTVNALTAADSVLVPLNVNIMPWKAYPNF